MARGKYTPKQLSSSVEKIVKDLYKQGFSRQVIGRTIRSQGIKVDNNSIQIVINEQKVRMTKTYVEHTRNSRRSIRVSYDKKVHQAESYVQDKKTQRILKRAELEEHLTPEEIKQEKVIPKEEKENNNMSGELDKAVAKNILATTHKSPIMAFISFERAVRYPGRQRKTSVIEKAINSLEDMEDARRILEEYEDTNGIYGEIHYLQYGTGFVSEDTARKEVMSGE